MLLLLLLLCRRRQLDQSMETVSEETMSRKSGSSSATDSYPLRSDKAASESLSKRRSNTADTVTATTSSRVGDQVGIHIHNRNVVHVM